jgi:opacity protein-like surface antigen
MMNVAVSVRWVSSVANTTMSTSFFRKLTPTASARIRSLDWCIFLTASIAFLANAAPGSAQVADALVSTQPGEPPLTVPRAAPVAVHDALTFGGWALYPVLNVYSFFDSNLYQSSVNPISAGGTRINPTFFANWSNSIFTSIAYGSIDRKIYPAVPESNTFDRQAGFIERYQALRDLTLSVGVDYTHRTNASAVQGAIPNPITNPSTPLPSPSGGVAINGPTVVNPYDQFTALASIEKLFNRGVLKLEGSMSQTFYESQVLAPDFSVKTVAGRGGVWLGPLLYTYFDGTDALTTTPVLTSNAYRVVGGIGSAPIGLFRASLYAGHQGTQLEGESSGTAGGLVIGGRLGYYPFRFWSLRFSVEQTTNISNITSTTPLAQSTSTATPLLVPVSASTRSTTSSLQSDYILSRDWTLYGRVDHTHVQFLTSSDTEDAWIVAAGVKYDVRRNTTLTADYELTRILSTLPNSSSTRNLVSIGGHYKF